MNRDGRERSSQGSRMMVALAAVALAVALLLLPRYVNTYQLYVASLWLVIATAGLGLVMMMGWCGQMALAQPAFVGIGAYGTVYLVGLGWPWLAAAAAASLVAAVVGIAIGLPTSRLRGFYFAIATLAFTELIHKIFIEAKTITGGVSGKPVEPISIFGLDNDASRWYVVLAIALITAATLLRIRRISFGRRMHIIRDAQIAAPALAISPTRTKLAAFALCAFIGGLAGAGYAQTVGYVTPSSFGVSLVLQLLVVVFVGGASFVAGPFLGAALVVVLRETMQDFGQWQNVVYGLSLAVAIFFLPEGLASLAVRIKRMRLGRARAPAGVSHAKGQA